MVLLILLAVLFFIQLFACAWYTMVSTGENKSKAPKYKVLCSAIYIGALLLCATIYNAYASVYFILLLAGMLVSFFGDIISELKGGNTTPLFITNSLSGILFTAGFVSLLLTSFGINPLKLLFLLPSLGVTLILMPFMCKKQGKYKPLYIIHIFATSLMLNSAVLLGVTCFSTKSPILQSGCYALITGASVLWFSRLLHTRQQIAPPPPYKPQLPRNMAYFFGQMAIACSLMITTFNGGLQ